MVSSFLLVIALSVDSFLASLAYGAEKISIPIKSAIVISGIGVSFLAIPLFAAGILQEYLPMQVCKILSSSIFFLIGISSLFQGTIKQFIKKYQEKKVTFEYSGISFVLNIYVDEKKADSDHSKRLSMKEAMYLAVALSIDSLVSGFALGIGIHNPIPVLCISFCVGLLSVLSGSYVGSHVSSMLNWNLSWISGIFFILIAIQRIL